LKTRPASLDPTPDFQNGENGGCMKKEQKTSNRFS
jgi:hypothetical protein